MVKDSIATCRDNALHLLCTALLAGCGSPDVAANLDEKDTDFTDLMTDLVIDASAHPDEMADVAPVETAAEPDSATANDVLDAVATADAAEILQDISKLPDANLCQVDLDCPAPLAKCHAAKCQFGVGCVEVVLVDDALCDDGDPCTPSKNTCEIKTGKCAMQAMAELTPCNADNNLCTKNDVCKAGVCTADANVCDCQIDKDCAGKDDGDLCNGIPYCNKAKLKCEVNPATVIVCQTVDDTVCSKRSCVPATGECKLAPVNENLSCDADGNPCTKNDTCKNGVCAADANTCECQSDIECNTKNDNNLCNGSLYCHKSSQKCVVNPATVVFCPFGSDTACSVNMCDPLSGKCSAKSINENGICDADGNPCTIKDICKSGTCNADANICECQKDADCAVKEDGNACNGTLFCDKNAFKCAVNPATKISCPGGNDTECQHNVCNPTSGKCEPTAVNQGKHCNGDDNICTLYDSCKDGSCKLGANLCSCQYDDDCLMDDGNLCNGSLYCDKGKGPFTCAVNPGSVVKCDKFNDTLCITNQCSPNVGKCNMGPGNEGKICDDDNECTLTDVCKIGVCLGGVKDCSDGDLCTIDTCDTLTGGCNSVPDPCDDKNQCTSDTCDKLKNGCGHLALADGVGCNLGACFVNAKCSVGVCKGAALNCDDSNSCTQDSCDNKLGCQHNSLSDASPCTDNTVCTKKDACIAGVCKGEAVVCPGASTCVDPVCNAVKGCSLTFNTKPCDADSDACTVNDSCAGGVCQPGFAAVCADNNPCTNDNCDVVKGCQFLNNTAQCDADGSACTDPDLCATGKCLVGKLLDCNDQNGCTNDTCGAIDGCKHTNNALSCDADGSVCTDKDTCAVGKCVAGAKLDCDDKLLCTDDSCDPKSGCKHANNTAPCDDGDPCTTGEACVFGNCGGGDPTVCDDNLACTSESCDPVKGCVYVPNNSACDDDAPCTVDVCDVVKATCTHTAAAEGGSCGGDNFCHADICGWAFAVANGANHTCAIRNDGTVACWGRNDFGQLGNGDSGANKLSATPAAVKNLSNAVAIAVGIDSTCAIQSGGKVYCWGENGGNKLQVANYAGVPATTATLIAGIADAVALSIGDKHQCALRATGGVVCWGNNQYAQIGNGAMGGMLAPTDVVDSGGPGGLLAGATSVSAAGGATCATLNDSSVRCWGTNYNNQMAQPGGDVAKLNPTAIAGLGAKNVSLGGYFGCAIKTAGSVACWGMGTLGQRGDGTLSGVFGDITPSNVAGLTAVAAIETGANTVCALRTNGTLACWGDNALGQLGDSGGGVSALPHDVLNLSGISQMSVGDGHSCAVSKLNQVSCWGSNSYGQLGNGNSGSGFDTAVPNLVTGNFVNKTQICSSDNKCDDNDVCTIDKCDAIKGSCTHVAGNEGGDCGNGHYCASGACKWATQIVSGDEHVCALHANGKVACWGRGQNGQLGVGISGNGQFKTSPTDVPGLSGVVSLSARGDTTCSVSKDGSVRCWGNNDHCQLGNGDASKLLLNVPTQIAGLQAVGVAVGYDHSCAWKADGTAFCWGEQSNGALGNKSNAAGVQCALQPVKNSTGINDITGVTMMAAGEPFSAALVGPGMLSTFGKNVLGTLGQFLPANQIVNVAGLAISTSTITDISAGWRHFCAVGAKSVLCFGDNGFGQIGGKPQPSSDVAWDIAPGNDLFPKPKSVGAGYQHTCVAGADGSVWCTGLNDNGQLGDGTVGNSKVVLKINGFSNQVQIAAGRYHTCSLSSTGEVSCWGRNEFGQLGQGTFGANNGSKVPKLMVASTAAVGEVRKFASVACDDGNLCTTDSCEKSTGVCAHTNAPDGPEPACGVGKVCSAGACKSPKVKMITAGSGFSCALMTDTSIKCWGYNSTGNLGNGVTGDGLGNKFASVAPVQVKLASNGGQLTGATTLSTKRVHSCAILSADTSPRCWGNNDYGALGTGQPWTDFFAAASGYFGNNATSIFTGDYTSCSTHTDTTARCCGLNDKGQLGNFYGTSSIPVIINDFGGIKEMALGGSFGCGRFADGTVRCSGKNDFGQLGIGKTVGQVAYVTTPNLVVGVANVTNVAAGTEHACASKSDGSVSCWGSGQYGMLGNGAASNQSSAVPVAFLNDVVQLSLNELNSCAVSASGRLLCWGHGANKRLANPWILGSSRPVWVPGLDRVTQVATGLDHVCALRADGSVWCWGHDDHGQIGDASAVDKDIGAPTLIPGTAAD